jgi:hypothetical protein
MSSNVDHPSHYNSHPAGIECIDVVECMSFNVGNVIKYLWRADHKGHEVEDLQKALWYLQREIARREKVRTRSPEWKFEGKEQDNYA